MVSQDTLPVDTGRKLNDLCTFNLRLVSTGWVAKYHKENLYIMYFYNDL